MASSEICDRLTYLPVELVEIIGEYVLWPDGVRENSYMRVAPGQRNLSHLSQTCRQLRDVLQPMLFRQICLHTRSQHPIGTLMRLVVALKERPDLAKEVKCISMRRWATTLPLEDPWRHEVREIPSFRQIFLDPIRPLSGSFITSDDGKTVRFPWFWHITDMEGHTSPWRAAQWKTFMSRLMNPSLVLDIVDICDRDRHAFFLLLIRLFPIVPQVDCVEFSSLGLHYAYIYGPIDESFPFFKMPIVRCIYPSLARYL